MVQIKLIEGLIVAAETLGGEVIFFSFSGILLNSFITCTRRFHVISVRLSLVC